MNAHAPAQPTLSLIRLPHGEGIELPAYETPGAAGMDLRAAVAADAPLTLSPGKRALVLGGSGVCSIDGYRQRQRRPTG